MSREFLNDYKTYDSEEEGYGSAWDWKRGFYHRMSKEEAEVILDTNDPYDILGVKYNSTKTEIKKAFYSLAMKWHPDKNPDNIEKCTEMMKKINAAYSLLTS